MIRNRVKKSMAGILAAAMAMSSVYPQMAYASDYTAIESESIVEETPVITPTEEVTQDTYAASEYIPEQVETVEQGYTETQIPDTVYEENSLYSAVDPAPSDAVEDTVDVAGTVPANVLTYSNAEAEDYLNGTVPLYSLTLTGEYDFAAGMYPWMEVMSGETNTSYMNALNDTLSESQQMAEPVLPLWIGIIDGSGNELQPNQNVTVTVGMDDVDSLTGTVLYHYANYEQWEAVPYTVMQDEDGIGGSVMFTVESFSPFIFSRISAVEPENEQETVEEEIVPEIVGEETVQSVRNAPMLGATAGKTITFQVVDIDGNPVSDESLGEGFDIHCISAASGDTTGESNNEFDIHISEATTVYPVDIPDEASADNPWLFVFNSDSNMYETDYIVDANVECDDTDIISGYANNDTLDVSGNTVVINIYRAEKTNATLQFNIQNLTQNGVPYPATLQAALTNIPPSAGQPTFSRSVEQTVTVDGMVTIDFGEINTAETMALITNSASLFVEYSITSAEDTEHQWAWSNLPVYVAMTNPYYTYSSSTSGTVGNIITRLSGDTLTEVSYGNGYVPLLQYVENVNVTFNVIHSDGTPVSQEEMGNGIVISYYQKLSSNSSNPAGSLMTITEPVTTATFPMNAAATGTGPYLLSVGGDVNGDVFTREFFGHADIIYGDYVIISANDAEGNPISYSGNSITVNIVKTDFASPVIKLNLDARENAVYPTTVSGTITPTWENQTGTAESFTAAVTEDGTVEIQTTGQYPVGKNVNISLNLTSGDEALDWSWDNYPDDSSGSKTNNQLVLRLGTDGALHTLSADGQTVGNEEYVFNYHAKSSSVIEPSVKVRLTDDGGMSAYDTWPVTVHAEVSKAEMVTKYSHTNNLDDTGNGSNNYGNYTTKNEVVTIPGAESLTVTITYQTESTYYDWACVWAGSYPNYSAYSHYRYSVSGKLGGTTKSTRTFTIPGDTVTLGFRSDSYGSNYYGYYAVITGAAVGGGGEKYYEGDIVIQQDELGVYAEVPLPSEIAKQDKYSVSLTPQNANWQIYRNLVSSDDMNDLQVTLPYLKRPMNFNIQTDASLDIFYPVYVKADAYIGSTLDASAVVECTENGSTPVLMGVSQSSGYESIGSRHMIFTAYKDAACTEPYTAWGCDNTYLSLGVDYNGNYVQYGNTPFTTFALSLKATDSISVPISLQVTDADAFADAYPVVMHATLSNGSGLSHADKVIQSAEDFSGTLTFSSPSGYFSTSDTYSIQCGFYACDDVDDIASAEMSGHFSMYPVTHASLSENYRLITNGTNALGIHYAQVSTDINPEPYTDVIDAEHPADFYVGMENTATGDSYARLSVGHTDANAFTYYSDIAMPVNTYVHATAYPVKEGTESEIRDTWTMGDVRTNIGNDGKLSRVLHTYESNAQNAVEVSIPVHMNIPDGVEHPYYLQAQGTDEAVHVMLLRKNADDSYTAVSPGDSIYTGDNYGNYGYFASYSKINVNGLDTNNSGSVYVGSHEPGIYYVISYVGESNTYYNFDDTHYLDPQWGQNLDPFTKVTVLDDGSVVDEEGNPYVAEFAMNDDIGRQLVDPVLDVQTTLPDGYDYTNTSVYYNSGINTPSHYQFTLTPTWSGYSKVYEQEKSLYFRAADTYNGCYNNGNYTKYQAIPNGHSQIGATDDYYAWYQWLRQHPSTSSGQDISSFTGIPTIDYLRSIVTNSGESVSFYNRIVYKYGATAGLPIGDYTLEYHCGSYTDRWYSDNLVVHLAEDGRFYAVNDDGTYAAEPYVMEFRLKTAEELTGEAGEEGASVALTVNTYMHDGITAEDALDENSKLMVELVERSAVDGSYTTIASGSLTITEEGETTVTLEPNGNDTIQLYDNNQYYIQYWMANGEEKDLRWTDTLLDIGIGAEIDFSTIVLQNECLLLPWKISTPQKAVRTESDQMVTFKPITSTSQIQEKANYIIATVNPYDGCLYALAYDENGGHQIKLLDAEEVPQSMAGFEYSLSESDNFANYVLQANKVKQADGSVSLQLKTSVKNDAGKNVSMKLGQSSTVLQPLFDGSAGTATIRQDGGNDDAGAFSIWKGTYARLEYMPEMFGYSGFDVQGYYTGSQGSYPRAFLDYQLSNNEAVATIMAAYILPQDSKPYNGQFAGFDSPYGNQMANGSAFANEAYENQYSYNIPNEYLTQEYINSLANTYNPYNPVLTSFIILSDNVPEETEIPEVTNEYTLIKTAGDFMQTFVSNNTDSYAADMVLVWTDGEGKEWVLNPNGLKQIKSEVIANDYRKIRVGADNELIPNNNSGTSSRFAFNPADVEGTLEMVFASPYSFRKSRQNTNETKDYLTLTGEDAWTRSDDAAHGDGLVYILQPTSPIRSQSDYDSPQSYTLAVIRDGVTSYLGVAEDDNGKKQMAVVSSKNDAIEFKVYSDRLQRYYSSAYGSDLYRYYRVTNIEDINAYDEILIVYNDGEKRVLVSDAYRDSSALLAGVDNSYYGGSYIGYVASAVEVLPEYQTVDSRDAEYPDGAAYKWRFNTDEYVKKPFAYMDPTDDSIIWAQGIGANAIGTAKSESNKQRKYESVTALADGQKIYIKAGYPDSYYGKSAETNFFKADNPGEFFIRGGKSDAWLGTSTYTKVFLRLTDGTYQQSDEKLRFTTVATDNRVPFEIYRRSTTNETFNVEYYTTDNVLERTELKPKESFVLTQKMDEKVGEQDYIFVGWTYDPEKVGYLSLSESANLFDFDDLSKVASVKDSVKERYSLLGNCAPEGINRIDYASIEDLVVNDVLKVYPVYAIKGYSSAISANDENQMIIGASDFKDTQMSGSGTPSTSERWLGSINIEVYRDGELWVPGVGGSTIGKKKLLGNSSTPPTATLYFAYHNDNSADLNIKFIADEVTADTLYEYMASGEFVQTEPSHNYIIDAVWAEQGGSEDGLKYRYNWMSEDVGGQLDNVKGGSTVKIYVTTKYQVKYFLDNDGTGYKELTGAQWQDDNYYSTPGTDEAVEALKTSAMDYFVTPDGDYPNLINETPSSGTTFKDEDITRGEYQMFLYKFNSTSHVIPIADLPGEDVIGAGKLLNSDKWAIRDPQVAKYMDWSPDDDWTMQGTSYGTGNTVYSFIGESSPFEDVEFNTYHLTANVKSDLKITKTVESDEPADLAKYFTFDITLTDNIHENPEDKVIINGTYGDVVFTNNVGSVTMKSGEEKVAETLPAGLSYQVTEREASGYQLQSSSGTTGQIANGEVKVAAFTNVPVTSHSITIDKTVSGNMGDQTKAFAFTLNITGQVPETLAYKLYENDEEVESGTKTVTGGNASFALQHGQKIIFPEVPDGAVYAVTEARADMDGYITTATATLGTVTAAKAVTGTLTDDESIHYTNARSMRIPTSADTEAGMGITAIGMAMLAAWLIRRRRRLV